MKLTNTVHLLKSSFWPGHVAQLTKNNQRGMKCLVIVNKERNTDIAGALKHIYGVDFSLIRFREPGDGMFESLGSPDNPFETIFMFDLTPSEIQDVNNIALKTHREFYITSRA